MAEQLMRSWLARQSVAFTVASAGISARSGQEMHPMARAALATRGLAIGSWRSQRVTQQLIASSHLILTATASHRAAVVTLEPRSVRRTFTLLQFARFVGASGISASSLQAQDPAVAGGRLIDSAQAARSKLQPVESVLDDVADPIGRPQDSFDRCAEVIEDAVLRIVAPS
jgi:protein-tyrosine phosphatase